MGKIRILPVELSNKIAAGEIVERPSSVLKELLENAVDAGSRSVFVDLEEGGRALIRVTDDGCGMTREDALLSFERHATSKLRNEADLDGIGTLGFRGEAIPSIASVSRVRLVTSPGGEATGVEIVNEGGNTKTVRETAAPPGTLFEVDDLFYNTPARRKFMKSPSTELAHSLRVLQQIGLPHFGIHFRLRHKGRELIHLPPAGSLRDRVLQVMGQDEMDHLIGISGSSGVMRLTGFVSRPPFSRATRDHLEFFINRRCVRSPLLSHAVLEAYENQMMKGRYPSAVLFIEVPPDGVDVNIHPAKREVRFRNPQAVHDWVRNEVRNGLGKTVRLRKAEPESVPDRYPSFSGFTSGAATRESLDSYGLPGVVETPSGGESVSTFMAPLGQIDRTYVVARVDAELHILDQHAAHERILFDRLTEQTEAGRLESQPLLIPEKVELSAAAAARLKEMLPSLKAAGLEVEEFGGREFLVRSVPAVLGPIGGRGLVLDLAEDFELDHESKPLSRPIRDILASMACHAAVKAHQALGPAQMNELLRDVQRVKAATCPHGRPIRLAFTVSDLEKLFRRK
jgi:DNA mismatch repair protein MutL